MALTKEKKRQIVKELEELFSRQKGMFFVSFWGVKSKDIFELRKKLKSENSFLRVVKKKLFEIALKNKKIPLWEKIKEIPYQLAIVSFFDQEITPAKIIFEFSEKNKNFKILGGIVDNNYFSESQVEELAKLPSRYELFGRFLNSLNFPLLRLVNIFSANTKGLINILKKIGQ